MMNHELNASRLTRITAFALLAACASSQAVITIGPRSILSTADYMTGARGQYIGRWGSYIGTPIGPRHFMTANHIGDGGSGGTFFYHNGTATETTYQAVRVANQDDLAIWQLTDASPSFTLWAPVYTASDETARDLVAIGRGTDRGAEVRFPANTGDLRGWQWGGFRRRRRHRRHQHRHPNLHLRRCPRRLRRGLPLL